MRTAVAEQTLRQPAGDLRRIARLQVAELGFVLAAQRREPQLEACLERARDSVPHIGGNFKARQLLQLRPKVLPLLGELEHFAGDAEAAQTTVLAGREDVRPAPFTFVRLQE